MTIKTRIVRIGNSQGFRVPRALLDEAQLPEEIELSAQPGRILITGVRLPRTGWADSAKLVRERGDDTLLDETTSTRFDRDEWTW